MYIITPTHTNPYNACIRAYIHTHKYTYIHTYARKMIDALRPVCGICFPVFSLFHIYNIDYFSHIIRSQVWEWGW